MKKKIYHYFYPFYEDSNYDTSGFNDSFSKQNKQKPNINCTNFKRYSDYDMKTEDKYILEWRKYYNWCFHTIILPFPLENAPLLA